MLFHWTKCFAEFLSVHYILSSNAAEIHVSFHLLENDRINPGPTVCRCNCQAISPPNVRPRVCSGKDYLVTDQSVDIVGETLSLDRMKSLVCFWRTFKPGTALDNLYNP